MYSLHTVLLRTRVLLVPNVAPSQTWIVPVLVPIKRYSPSFENERHVGYPDLSITTPFNAVPDSLSQTLKLLSLQIATSLLEVTACATDST